MTARRRPPLSHLVLARRVVIELDTGQGALRRREDRVRSPDLLLLRLEDCAIEAQADVLGRDLTGQGEGPGGHPEYSAGRPARTGTEISWPTCAR
jgi:hypothetical protein